MNQCDVKTAIEARNLSRYIGKRRILHDLSFKISANTITSILGPSGSGKTTLLNTLAGFEPLCQGELFINGQLTNKVGFTLAPNLRRISIVFQDHALFPHLTVLENLKTGLRSDQSKAVQIKIIMEKLHLSQLSHRLPHELSGGQQQRTALARALVARSDIILLDEPFANLNQDLQIDVGIELIELLKEYKTTAVMVTHDQNDAMAISDQIIILSKGQLLQSGSPDELYRQPKSREVAAFLSRGNFISAQYIQNNQAQSALGLVNISMAGDVTLSKGDELEIWAHPEDILIDYEQGHYADVIQHYWRPLDILLRVRTQENKQLLVKTEQSVHSVSARSVPIRLRSTTTYRAFFKTLAMSSIA